MKESAIIIADIITITSIAALNTFAGLQVKIKTAKKIVQQTMDQVHGKKDL